MSDCYTRFYIYKGYKIYEPSLINYLNNGTKYWNYWPPKMSSQPMSGYSTKENYYKAKQKQIDERISFGHWTDNFRPLIK
tara:strand:+ start:225 stop:464 length:240 start_codon:yes stop_codon:yes gene_type:complete